MGDQVVYAAHIEFSLSNRFEVGIAREEFPFIPVYGLEEQAETMERRAHGFRHGESPEYRRGQKGVQVVRSEKNEPLDRSNHQWN